MMIHKKSINGIKFYVKKKNKIKNKKFNFT